MDPARRERCTLRQDAALQIRTATIDDVAELVALNELVQALHVENRPKDFKPLDPELAAEGFERLLGDPSVSVLVAVRGDEMLGYAVLTERVSPENPYCPEYRWMEVDQIGVRATFRRQGVGRALIEAAARRAEQAGGLALGLTTWAFNRDAQQAFQRLGFVPKTLRFERRTK